MHALYYLDAQGQVIWQLGGMENDFTGIGEGDWTFGWQHHAAFIPEMATKEERFISVSPFFHSQRDFPDSKPFRLISSSTMEQMACR